MSAAARSGHSGSVTVPCNNRPHVQHVHLVTSQYESRLAWTICAIRNACRNVGNVRVRSPCATDQQQQQPQQPLWLATIQSHGVDVHRLACCCFIIEMPLVAGRTRLGSATWAVQLNTTAGDEAKMQCAIQQQHTHTLTHARTTASVMGFNCTGVNRCGADQLSAVSNRNV